MNETHKDKEQSSAAAESSKKPGKQRISLRAKIAGVLALIVLFSFLAVYGSQPTIHEKLTLTYLDNLTLADLKEKPEGTYADTALVGDYTIYGTSLVFYDQAYDALGTDGYFGRNVQLTNIQTGETIRTTFTGGADGGIDLQSLPAGVYEIYLEDGYTPKRAYMEEEFRSEPLITVRDDKSVKSIELNASADYLSKFDITCDKNYLYLTVTESIPIVKIADVVLDPSGLLMLSNGVLDEEWSENGFTESEQSWQLAQMVASELENAGLRVVFSRSEDEASSYLGADSRISTAYDSQAKIFLSLSMADSEEARPYLLSSPFTNARLGNDLVTCLNAQGVELAAVSSLAQLNPGNSYDLLTTDEEYQYTQFSAHPALRETGGKVTGTGLLEGWSANAQYSNANGMNAVVFNYASTENPESITYYQQHREAIAKGLAQGILEYLHIEPDAALDSQASQQKEGSE